MFIRKCFSVFVAGLVVSLLGGCASILSESEYPVTIDSNPSGVEFYVTDSTGVRVHTGTTPNTVTLPAKRGYFKPHTYTIYLQPVGAAPKEHVIRNSVDGWYFGNLLLGGLLGMLIVDPLTGAMFKYPSEVMVDLGQTSASTTFPATKALGLTITSIETLDYQQRSKLIPIAN